MSDDGVRHVVPINDLREHICDEKCWCNPKVDDDGVSGRVIVHNSMDGREKYETGERKAS